jgi:hypothetical protein
VTGLTLLPSKNCAPTCNANEYHSEDYTTCLTCPSCCTACDLDRAATSPFPIVCSATTAGFSYTGGSCVADPTPGTPGTDPSDPAPGPTDDTIDYVITKNEEHTTFFVSFDSEPTFFTLENQVKIVTESGWTDGTEYTALISKVTDRVYTIEIKYLLEDYDETIDLQFSNIGTTHNGSEVVYQDKIVNFQVTKLPQVFGFSEGVSKGISSTSTMIADYGVFLGIAVPAMFSIVVPLNILRMLALVPVRFPIKFLGFVKLFVRFEESDLLAILTNTFYTQEYKDSKIYVAKNSIFRFSSIYPRIRGLKILLRIFANLLYLTLIRKMVKKIKLQEKERKALIANGALGEEIAEP